MNVFRLPDQWRSAFECDSAEKPALPDPVPERRLARLLAAYVVSGLFFMILPGTVLGVWNLVGISSQRVPKSLSLGEAARADEVPPEILIEKLGDFFESRLPRSLRQNSGAV